MPGCDNDDDSTGDHQGYEAAPADKDDYDVPQLLRTSQIYTHTHKLTHTGIQLPFGVVCVRAYG